ncbi:MAG TPA: pilin [Candidatus Nanoarchaeia archaeon]|nr:pilin [Candidatus Nanoarchaeia archaeon]
MKKNNLLNCTIALILMVLPLAYSVHAVTITGPSSTDVNTFNQILAPVMKVYNFVKYAASVLALLFIVFAAVQMFMNNNPSEKEQAKTKVMYIVIGLGLIWVAPIIVNYLTT